MWVAGFRIVRVKKVFLKHIDKLISNCWAASEEDIILAKKERLGCTFSLIAKQLN